MASKVGFYDSRRKITIYHFG